MTTTLKQQIAELTAKHELDEFAKNLFPDIKTMSVLSGKNKRIYFTPDPIDFKKIIDKLPPSETNFTLSGASGMIAELSTPYRIDIDNPCRPNNFSPFRIDISYKSGDYEISIELPINAVSNWVTTGVRTITDSEYHYFINESNLHKKQVMCYSFKSPQVNWHGGNKTCTDSNTVIEIINHLLSL